MGYAKVRGFDYDDETSKNSSNYFYLKGGLVINRNNNEYIIVLSSKFKKEPGKQYVYYNGSELYLSSSLLSQSEVIFECTFEDDLSVTFTQNGITQTTSNNTVLAYENELSTTIQSALDNKTAEIQAAITTTITHNLHNMVDYNYLNDFTNETFTETYEIINGRINTKNIINDIISLYVENIGILENSSINTITDTEVTFDSSLNNLMLEITYTTKVNGV